MEVQVRAKDSEPRRSLCEGFYFPMGEGVGAAMLASDLRSKRMLVLVSPVFGSLTGSPLVLPSFSLPTAGAQESHFSSAPL